MALCAMKFSIKNKNKNKKYNMCVLNLTSDYTYNCADSVGGIKKVYIGEWKDNKNVSGGVTYSGSLVTGLTSFNGATTSHYRFDQGVGDASLVIAAEDNDSKSTAYTATLTIMMKNSSAATLNIAKTLKQGMWSVIVEKNDGEWFLLGYDSPTSVGFGEAGTGKALTDMNGFTLTFKNISKNGPVPVTSALVAQVCRL
jgi:hypothetical protein